MQVTNFRSPSFSSTQNRSFLIDTRLQSITENGTIQPSFKLPSVNQLGFITNNGDQLFTGKVIFNPADPSKLSQPVCLKELRYIENLEITSNINNGTANYIGFKSPDLLDANTIYTLPAGIPSGLIGQQLTLNAENILSWSDAGTGDVESDLIFTTDNSITTVDLPNGNRNIQQSILTIDDLGNIDKSSISYIHERGGLNNFGAGSDALANINTGGLNTGIGVESLNSMIGGFSNTAVGYRSLSNSVNDNNTAIGSEALRDGISSFNNTAIGNICMQETITANSCVGIGHNCMNKNEGDQCIGIGQGVLDGNVGINNIGIGYLSTIANTIGINNTLTGAVSFFTNSTGSNNSGFGYQTLRLCTVDGLTAVGSEAVQLNQTGLRNSGFGRSALQLNQIGNDNTACGYQSLQVNKASNNTSVGSQALELNITGVQNVSIGSLSLLTNISGNDNTACGYQSLRLNTATDNTAYGSESLEINTVGTRNTALGRSALESNNSGDNNVAVGHQTLEDTDASDNTAIGFMSSTNIITGTRNVSVGANSLNIMTGGNDNICIGESSGSLLNIDASANICIGNPGVNGLNSSIKLGLTGMHINTALTGSITLDQQYEIPVTGETVILGGDVSILLIDPLGSLAALDIDMPVSPIDKTIVKITITKSISVLSHNGNGNLILSPFGISTTANESGTWIFRSSSNTWYALYNKQTSSSSTALPIKYIDGLTVSDSTISTKTISSGECRSDDNTLDIVNLGILTPNIAVSGVNGLDTGVETSNTWYSIWVISGGGNPTASLLSLSSTTPTMPGTYDKKRRVGWVRNDPGSNFYDYFTPGTGRDRLVIWAETHTTLTLLSSGSATINTAVDCSEFIPPTSLYSYLNIRLEADGDASFVNIRPTGSTLSATAFRIYTGQGGSIQEVHGNTMSIIQLNTMQSLDYINGDTGQDVFIRALGYIDNL